MNLRSLLPRTVHVTESDRIGRVRPLRDDEARFVVDAVDARRREFALGRSLAHAALGTIGVPDAPIGVGAHRDPQWPPGTVGSITHCDGYAAAAVAHRRDVRSLGIDAEPASPLPPDLVELVTSPVEHARLDGAGPLGERIAFSAKESIYKAWFPLTGRWLGFEDCDLTLTPTDAAAGSFVGCVDDASLVDDSDVGEFFGRYMIGGGHILTAVVVSNN